VISLSPVSSLQVALAQLSSTELDRSLVLSVDSANLMLRVLLMIVYVICALPGMCLMMPIALVADNVSRREAAKALSKSSVKIAGRDVVATWKLMVSVSITPVLHVVYALVFGTLWGATAGTAYFFFGPLLVGLAVLAIERGSSLFRSIRILFVAMYNPKVGDTLVLTRSKLQHDVRQLVKSLGWDVALKHNSQTRHLYRRFSRTGERSFDEAVAMMDSLSDDEDFDDPASVEEWELGDSFFQTPHKRESPRRASSTRSTKSSRSSRDTEKMAQDL
jgi:hypothetical protein